MVAKESYYVMSIMCSNQKQVKSNEIDIAENFEIFLSLLLQIADCRSVRDKKKWVDAKVLNPPTPHTNLQQIIILNPGLPLPLLLKRGRVGEGGN